MIGFGRYALFIPHEAGAGAAWRHDDRPCVSGEEGRRGCMKPAEIREEIKDILDRFTEAQVKDVLRLVELTLDYLRISKANL